MKKKKEKIIYKEDDGRTLYDMSGLSQNSNTHGKEKNNNSSVYLTKKERRAVIIAGFKHYLPMLLTGILGFAIAIILIYLWLS